MQGTVLKFDKQTSSGLIAASDGNRYEFKGENVQSNFDALKTGVLVDFQIDDNNAVQIYLLNVSKGNDEKSKIAAGLLAIFLGVFGIHKFYLGYTKTGIIFLLIGVLGSILLLIPTVIISIIALIEGIIYLTKSDESFDKTYVQNEKKWF
jgi:TM2 domain-containing membrane protein YozV|tara:strand:- start:640 stop:1089 length:450 start_codon:yes stop_codon:yes gene_type:complete